MTAESLKFKEIFEKDKKKLEPIALALIPKNFGHGHWIRALCLHPAEDFLLTASNDCTVRLWKYSTGKCQSIFINYPYFVTDIALLGPNKFVCSLAVENKPEYKESMRIFNLDSGRKIKTICGQIGVSCLTTINDNIIVSGATDKTIKIHYVSEDQESLILKEHSSFISTLQSIDNRFFLSGSNDRTIKLWDSKNGEVVQTFTGHSSFINDIAIKDQLFASASADKTVKIWDRKTNELVHTFSGHGSGVTSVRFLSNTKLVSGTRKGILYFWDLNTKKSIKTIDLQSWISAITIDRKGHLIIATRRNNISRLDSTGKKKILIRKGPFLQKKAILTKDGNITSQTLRKEIYRWEILPKKISFRKITNKQLDEVQRINKLPRSHKQFVVTPIAEFISIEFSQDKFFKKIGSYNKTEEFLFEFIKAYQNLLKSILKHLTDSNYVTQKDYRLKTIKNDHIQIETQKNKEKKSNRKEKKIQKALLHWKQILEKIHTS